MDSCIQKGLLRSQGGNESSTGVGPYQFFQHIYDGRPVAFFSQALHGRNILLSKYEKEMLALVLAIQKWQSYLLGQTFVVRTDHQNLKFLWEQRITTYA